MTDININQRILYAVLNQKPPVLVDALLLNGTIYLPIPTALVHSVENTSDFDEVKLGLVNKVLEYLTTYSVGKNVGISIHSSGKALVVNDSEYSVHDLNSLPCINDLRASDIPNQDLTCIVNAVNAVLNGQTVLLTTGEEGEILSNLSPTETGKTIPPSIVTNIYYLIKEKGYKNLQVSLGAYEEYLNELVFADLESGIVIATAVFSGDKIVDFGIVDFHGKIIPVANTIYKRNQAYVNEHFTGIAYRSLIPAKFLTND